MAYSPYWVRIVSLPIGEFPQGRITHDDYPSDASSTKKLVLVELLAAGAWE
jgi:hypothetical protein